VLANRKMIFEPWDIGPGGYQLGGHPPGTAEWNDRFRDSTRKFWRGDEGSRGEIARRLSGSGDIFDKKFGRRPWASVNFITAHDGFTLHDLTSYENKHNEANSENDQDGHNENYGANWGIEGPTDDPDIIALRDRVKRSMLTTLMLSLGTPMVLAGDEFGRTQRGNNNAYCQDNDISWLDWKMAETPEGLALTKFVARLSALRRSYAVLHSAKYLHGQENPLEEITDIDWFGMTGEPLDPQEWENPIEKTLIMRRALRRDDGQVEVVLLLLNAAETPLDFTLPGPVMPWRLLLDSAAPETEAEDVSGSTITVADRGAVVLAALVESPEP
jgi:glycogen operon protein